MAARKRPPHLHWPLKSPQVVMLEAASASRCLHSNLAELEACAGFRSALCLIARTILPST